MNIEMIEIADTIHSMAKAIPTPKLLDLSVQAKAARIARGALLDKAHEVWLAGTNADYVANEEDGS